ncbi:F-box domain, cyclin-like protein [Cynara cardunculus var. scolymus]|uniref:F-box domain, cyclin-like protein n=1 Tax=Cynara cardunculus var. scolymus TaxID=59895 RepID=A0A103Y923_CYNCS|nr:F-box domain, cyclin-like protein [Cynara cardunculus var. scolymus]
MGSGFSTNFPVNNDETPASCSHLPPKQLGGLGDLPENCLAMVLDHFDPPEICKLAHVNRAFYRASCADVLWESKLPENYGVLVKKLLKVYEYDCRLSKKDIYARLFQTIAYLRQIWWLEVEGHVDFYFPTGIYSLFFRLHLGKPSQGQNQHSSSNNQEIHGWTINPVQFKFSISDGQNAMSKHFLNKQGKWLCYHVGDFHVKESYEPTKIKFSMTQIDCTHQKGGLSLDSVLICPCGTKTHGIV